MITKKKPLLLCCVFCWSITVVAFTASIPLKEAFVLSSKTSPRTSTTTVASTVAAGTANNMEVWCCCGDAAPSNVTLSVMKSYDFDALLLHSSDLPTPNFFDDDDEDYNPPRLIIRREDRLYDGGRNCSVEAEEKIIGIAVEMDHGAEQQQEALAAMGSVPWILVHSGDWKMIPAENLIVAARATGTKIAFRVNREEDVVGFSRALEIGVDALLVSYDDDANIINRAIQAREERRSCARNDDAESNSNESPSFEVVTGSCWRRTSSSVLADRVCVDLVQSLRSSEGCWLGSSAKLLALILSEAATSSFVPSRPFRVNAGPVHSYILMGDGTTTKYLSELQAGDEVLVYDAETGESRSVATGRLEIEIRPCVQVTLSTTAEDKQQEAQVFLQQAETVRLGQKSSAGESSFVRVTELRTLSKEEDKDPTEKDAVLLRIAERGTHIGSAYSGKVVER